jgi:hypothetical protein
VTGKILSHLLTNIPAFDVSSLAAKDYDWRTKGVYRLFDQHELTDAGWFDTTGLAQYGFIFYPN